ncbi:MAG TPA: phosphatidylserine/phosphatidylglycerophosphate/cardiolipin synthase family protein [Gemmatimonadaceae bacterium]|nr:phosphatidylserine/phosphatidylglycerophosphate/cardiolipin synthase family protein [Gemmatimonadaceae bacterium]
MLTEPSVRVAAVGGGLSFTRGLWRIASADVTSGNRVRLLRDGPATFDAMYALAESARERLDVEQYIVRDDSCGDRFAEVLVAAARRGVAVRLLADWVGRMGTSRRYFDAMRDAGVDVRIFNPPGFRRWLGVLPRDHRKVFLVDGTHAITGGIGIGNEWTKGEVEHGRRQRWRDTAIEIEGGGASMMQAAFERMWARAVEGPPPFLRRRLRRRARHSTLDSTNAESALVGIVEGEPGRLRVERALQIQCIGAERTIWIASAYFAPSMYTVEALIGAARDNVDVRILVPSRYDHAWMGWLSRRYYRRLLRNGVRIWEWQGPMMHGKWSVVDSRWVRVGSTDFNPLGIAINFELDAVVEDCELGRDAHAMFERDLENSREVPVPPSRWKHSDEDEPSQGEGGDATRSLSAAGKAVREGLSAREKE